MELDIISFNIRCCDDKNGNSIEERAPRLNKIISQYEPDLIGLQEYRPGWEEHIDKYFCDKYEIFAKYRAESEKEASPMLWRKDKFECIKTGYFWLSDTPDGYLQTKNCLLLMVKLPNRKFLHMQNLNLNLKILRIQEFLSAKSLTLLLIVTITRMLLQT